MNNTSKEELLKRCGNISQIAGAERLTKEEGVGKGVSVIRVRNGLGLDFSVVPDKGLDIHEAYFKGNPLAWISKRGLVSNYSFNDRDSEWLRSFGGGMLVTCGLRNAGPACEVEGEHFGLHGRYTSIAAQNISIQEYWKEDVFYIEISGLVCEANTFGENLALYRTISVNNRENKIYLKDRLVNEGFKTEGIMLLYHLNWGYPLLSENTKLVLDAAKSELRDEMPGEEGNWNHFTPPVPNFEEIVYFHDLKEDTEGKTGYQLENPEINTRVKVSWHKKDLPFLTEWKMTGEGEYVLGLEPGNCQPIGRKQAIENKSLEMLDRLSEKEVSIEIDVENIKAKE